VTVVAGSCDSGDWELWQWWLGIRNVWVWFCSLCFGPLCGQGSFLVI